jgi:hypothetical protein
VTSTIGGTDDTDGNVETVVSFAAIVEGVTGTPDAGAVTGGLAGDDVAVPDPDTPTALFAVKYACCWDSRAATPSAALCSG